MLECPGLNLMFFPSPSTPSSSSFMTLSPKCTSSAWVCPLNSSLLGNSTCLSDKHLKLNSSKVNFWFFPLQTCFSHSFLHFRKWHCYLTPVAQAKNYGIILNFSLSHPTSWSLRKWGSWCNHSWPVYHWEMILLRNEGLNVSVQLKARNLPLIGLIGREGDNALENPHFKMDRFLPHPNLYSYVSYCFHSEPQFFHM